jgi:hypothetical protein
MVLVAGLLTVFALVDSYSEFARMRNSGEPIISEIARPLDELYSTIILTLATVFVAVVAWQSSRSYHDNTVIYQATYSNKKYQMFFSELFVTLVMSILVTSAILLIITASYFLTINIYDLAWPWFIGASDVIRMVGQVMFYMVIHGLTIFAISKIIRNMVASIILSVLWQIGIINIFFSFSFLGLTRLYYPHNLLMEVMGQGVCCNNMSQAVSLPMHEAIIWSVVITVGILILSYFVSARRDVIK